MANSAFPGYLGRSSSHSAFNSLVSFGPYSAFNNLPIGLGNLVTIIGSEDTWFNQNYLIVSSSSLFASVNLGSLYTTSDIALVTGFNFNIPSGATVKQVIVNTYGTASSGVTDPSAALIGLLYASGSQIGHGVAVSTGSGIFTAINITFRGGLWGNSSITPAQVNSSTFGVGLFLSGSLGNSDAANLNNVTMTIVYQ